MSKKLTNKNIDGRLMGRNIKRVSNIINARSPMTFKCEINTCSHEWITTPDCVLNDKKSGCPKCAGNIQLTNQDIDNKLVSRNIKRMSDIIDTQSPMKFKCEINTCGHEWTTTSNSVLSGKKNGCPKCAGTLKLTQKEVDHKLLEKNIKILDKYININAKHNFECLICKYEWKNTIYNIINKNYRCPRCNDFVGFHLNNEIVDYRLKKIHSDIIRIGEITKARNKADFKCLLCDFEWEAAPNNILNQKTGCPKCRPQNKNEILVFDILKNNNIDFKYQLLFKKITNKIRKNIKIDFYIVPNIIIEYNGAQHYRPVRFGGIEQERADNNFTKQKKRDKYLRKKCKENNIHLIEIDGRKYTNSKLKKYLTNEIIPHILKLQ